MCSLFLSAELQVPAEPLCPPGGTAEGCRQLTAPFPILLPSPEQPVPSLCLLALGQDVNLQGDVPPKLLLGFIFFFFFLPPFYSQRSRLFPVPWFISPSLTPEWGTVVSPPGTIPPVHSAAMVTHIYSVWVQRAAQRGRQPAQGLEKSTEP